MKKLTISLLSTGLFLSFSSFAFSPDCCVPSYSSGLCAPNLPGGFYIGVTGLYLRPSETGLGQVTDSWQYVDAFGPTDFSFRALDKSAKPKLHWGWGIDVGYDFPCTAYNIEASYFHFDKDHHSINNATPNDTVSFASYFFTNAFFPIAAQTGTSLLALSSNAHLKYEVDQADIKFGRQFVDCRGRFKFQPSIGARYADLEHRLTFASPATLVTVGTPDIITDGIFRGAVKSEFHGAGPMLSLDMHYGFCYGIGLVGKFNSALLVGDVKSNNFITSELGVIFPTAQPVIVTTNRFDRPEIETVVPNVDAKIGFDYTYCFCNRSSLTLEIGYQVNKYWDAFNLLRGDITTPPAEIGQRIVAINTDSFALQGPYATLTWHM